MISQHGIDELLLCIISTLDGFKSPAAEQSQTERTESRANLPVGGTKIFQLLTAVRLATHIRENES
jgi:hypothetical protein